jgi:hypothetical protein
MHTLVVSMATNPDRYADVSTHLRNDVPAWAEQQPGFVRGEWLLSESRDVGMGFVVFDSAAAASQAAAGPRRYVNDDDRAWNITGVTVYESVATATS